MQLVRILKKLLKSNSPLYTQLTFWDFHSDQHQQCYTSHSGSLSIWQSFTPIRGMVIFWERYNAIMPQALSLHFCMAQGDFEMNLQVSCMLMGEGGPKMWRNNRSFPGPSPTPPTPNLLLLLLQFKNQNNINEKKIRPNVFSIYLPFSLNPLLFCFHNCKRQASLHLLWRPWMLLELLAAKQIHNQTSN